MNLTQCLRELRAYDTRRESLPGEHAMAAAAGGALLVAALFAPSPLRATLRALLGGALLVRAATGRDGLAALQGKPVDSTRQPWLFPTSAGAGRPRSASSGTAPSGRP